MARNAKEKRKNVPVKQIQGAGRKNNFYSTRTKKTYTSFNEALAADEKHVEKKPKKENKED